MDDRDAVTVAGGSVGRNGRAVSPAALLKTPSAPCGRFILPPFMPYNGAVASMAEWCFIVFQSYNAQNHVKSRSTAVGGCTVAAGV